MSTDRCHDDDLDVAGLIDGFPVTAPWIGCGGVWFDDLENEDRAVLDSMFERAAQTGQWPAAPDVGRPDDPTLLVWVTGTVHIVSRLARETLAFAEHLTGRDRAWPARGFVAGEGVLGPCLDAIESAREAIDATPGQIGMAVELNALTLALSDTATFPPPPRSLARYVDLDGRHWSDASYRPHRGREFYARLELELAHSRAASRPALDTTPWDLHAWVFALVTLWTSPATTRTR